MLENKFKKKYLNLIDYFYIFFEFLYNIIHILYFYFI